MSNRAAGIGFIAIFVFFIWLFNIASFMNHEIVEFTVTDKQVKTVCDGKHSCTTKYMVYTDHTTYQITDSVLMFRFDSSDVYGGISIGKTYRAEAYGWRVPFFSWYQNLDNVREVSD